MNPLPTGPEAVATTELQNRYFRDMKRWGFDIAYNAYYAYPYSAVRGKFQPIYKSFAAQAKEQGFPACVQVQVTVADVEDIPLRESQYYFNNRCQTYKHHVDIGTQNFFASFASKKWRNFLKRLLETFAEYGYRWVVFEEPMFRVDLPGTRDRFYDLFKKRYPDLGYPTRHTESESYLQVQVFKQQLLIEFLDELSRYAKKVGFEKVGIMPWFFTPTHENTPEETWHTGCDLGQVHHLDPVDFIIVRMQPDNIYAGAMTEEGGLALPWLSYLENQAHQGGKPIIAVNNPSNEHLLRGSTDYWVLPEEYFSRYTLAAAAAAPTGMTRHWYGKNYLQDKKNMALYRKINPLLSRLGSASSPIALVYSYRGLIHAMPRSAKQLWTPYRRLASKLLYESKVPTLTLYADTLIKGLKQAPEIQTLVLFEEYPLSMKEILFLKQWISSDSRRRLVLFARGRGQTYNLKHSPFQYNDRPTELMELFGLKTDYPFRMSGYGETARIRFAGKNPRDAFLGKKFDWRCYGWGAGTYRKSKNLEVLYQEESSGKPVITRFHYRGGGQAYLIAQGLEGPESNFPFASFLTGITETDKDSFPSVACSPDVLWNWTRNRYLVISNTAPEKGWARITGIEGKLWNIQQKKFEPVRATKRHLAPNEILLYRVVAKDDPILDIEGQIFLNRIVHQKDQAEIQGYFGRTTRIRSRRQPAQVEWLNHPHPFKTQNKKGYTEVVMNLDDSTEGSWKIKFSQGKEG